MQRNEPCHTPPSHGPWRWDLPPCLGDRSWRHSTARLVLRARIAPSTPRYDPCHRWLLPPAPPLTCPTATQHALLNQCVRLSLYVWWCMLTYDAVCWRVLTCADVYWRVLMCVVVCWRVLTCADLYLRMLTYADVFWRMLKYADACWRMLTCADICWSVLTNAEVCWRMLTYADVCWRMLTYADVSCICWRVLTNTDVCWRMTHADVCWRMLTYADVCWLSMNIHICIWRYIHSYTHAYAWLMTIIVILIIPDTALMQRKNQENKIISLHSFIDP